MKKIFLIFILALSACAPKTADVQRDRQFEIIEALNKREADKAMALIEKAMAEDPSNQELVYWQVQAQAIKAGIDVYGLFPLIKTQIFSTAISDWQTIRKYQKNMAGGGSTDINDLSEEEKKRLESIKAKKVEWLEKKDEDISYTIKFIDVSFLCWSVQRACMYRLHVIPTGVPSTTIYSNYYEYLLNKNEEECPAFSEEKAEEALVEAEELKPKNIRNSVFKELDAQEKRFYDGKQNQVFIKFSWTLREILPLIQKVPLFKAENGDMLKVAISKLQSVYQTQEKDSRLYRNSLQQAGLLSAYLTLAPMLESFDGIDIENDNLGLVLCKINTEKLFDQYPYMIAGLAGLQDVLKRTEFSEKNGKIFELYGELATEAPEALSQEKGQFGPYQRKNT